MDVEAIQKEAIACFQCKVYDFADSVKTDPIPLHRHDPTMYHMHLTQIATLYQFRITAVDVVDTVDNNEQEGDEGVD
ncbi:11787_t:CDS:2, partial [Entrophospora sp. SA101]